MLDSMMLLGRVVIKNRQSGELALCQPLRRMPGGRWIVSRVLWVPEEYRLAPCSNQHASWVASPNVPPRMALLVRKLR